MLSLLFSLATSAALYSTSEEKAFVSWMRKSQQMFTGDEYHFRLGVFLANQKYVQQFNSNPKNTYKLSVNKFAALTNSEYQSLLGYKSTLGGSSKGKFLIPSKPQRTATENLDWREKGVVNDVKNQLFCGSCWAFSVIQSVESVWAIENNQLLSLSEQNLVDCVDTCYGCNGGEMYLACDYVIQKQNGQFNLEEQYYYISIGEFTCYFDRYDKVAHISGYITINSGDEDDQAAKIEQYGPASVAIDASSLSFQLYWGGVYDNDSCSSTELDHGVGCVGFGVEDNVKYWIIRNSWGSWWGESGYIRTVRGKNNQCGVATESIIPRP